MIYDVYFLVIDYLFGIVMSQFVIDLISELLCGMCFFGVNYWCIEIVCLFGVGFSVVVGKVQFYFISCGLVLLCMVCGEQFIFESGDVLFIFNGDGYVLFLDLQVMVVNVVQLFSEMVCSMVSCINVGDQFDCLECVVIFSGCMDFEFGGMQLLVKVMFEVMWVSSLFNIWLEIQLLLVVMEWEFFICQVGYVGIFVWLVDVVVVLIVCGWVVCGCGNVIGWVQVLCDFWLVKVIYVMYQCLGGNWKVEDLVWEVGFLCLLFVECFFVVIGIIFVCYFIELCMWLVVQYIIYEGQVLEKVVFSFGYQLLVVFSWVFKCIIGQLLGVLCVMVCQSQFLCKVIYVVVDMKVLFFKCWVGDVEYQFGQLVGSFFMEDKLLVVYVQFLFFQWWKVQQCLLVIVYCLWIDYFEYCLFKCNVVQWMWCVQFLGVQLCQLGGVVFFLLQYKGIDQFGSVVIDGEDLLVDDIVLWIVVLVIDNW